jgi:uncharacterized membrane protein YbhN (UPF0104 family)
MKHRLLRTLGPALTLGLIAGAALLLYRSLSQMRLLELWQDLHEFPPSSILTAAGLTAASHLALTIYDYIGVRYIKRRIAYWRVALAAFTAYSISHSLGFPSVTGSTVRYRLYSRWGFGAVEVAQIMAVAGVTLFLGMFLIGGIAMLLDGGRVQAWSDLPSYGVNMLGALLLCVVAAYGTVGYYRREPLSLWGFQLRIPSPRFAGAQILVSSFDWLLVASVLYTLLPVNDVFNFATFLGVFVLAYFLGTISNVPGGLGVFEAVILKSLSGSVPPEAVLSSLLVYRGVYNLLPLALGGVIFLVNEIKRSRERREPAGTLR